MNSFNAGVQYDDFRGTTAADQSDQTKLTNFLIDEGLANSSERVVATRFCFNGNPGEAVEITSILCYLVDSEEYIERPNVVRAIDVEMTLPKYFSFFKRFDFVNCQSGVTLDEHTKIDGPHYD